MELYADSLAVDNISDTVVSLGSLRGVDALTRPDKIRVDEIQTVVGDVEGGRRREACPLPCEWKA